MSKRSKVKKMGVDPIDASRVISRGQFERLIDACPDQQTELLFELAFVSGLRVSEIVSLEWTHIDRVEQTLIVINGKGGKTRLIRFGARLEKCLASIEELRGSKKAAIKNLFITSRGAMSARYMQEKFKNAREKAGLPSRISFHSLRHGAAVRLLDQGVKINEIRSHLGHASVHTTSLYLGLTEDSLIRLKRAM